MSGIEGNKECMQWIESKFRQEQEQKRRDEFVSRICSEGFGGVSAQVVKTLWDNGTLKDKAMAYGINEDNAVAIITDAVKEEKLRIELEEARKVKPVEKPIPEQAINYQSPSATNVVDDKKDEVFDGRTFDPFKDDRLTNLSIADKIALKMITEG